MVAGVLWRKTRSSRDPDVAMMESRRGYFFDPREFGWIAGIARVSRSPSVFMMEAPEHGQRDDLALDAPLRWHRGLLADPLVGACGVVVANVLHDDSLKVPVVEDKDMVEALATQRPEKTLADGVHVRRADRGVEDPDARGAGKRIEGGPELVVAM